MSGNLTVTVLKDGASAVNNLTFDANGNTTAGGTVAMASSYLRNRIINGAMQIDQRNAGASVTPTASGYTLDRWQAIISAASKFSVQQNAGSVTPPAGYTKYLGVTSLSAYSIGASDYFSMYQIIEGFNVADLAWGTASASPVTLSFWVRSSLTGTFGGSVKNNATRSYPFTYTISSANTWEQKSITIPGDTSGTWLTDNSGGLFLSLALGVGSTYSGTPNTWAGANYVSATGATSVVAVNAATFYITGVQLEVGTVATPFERRLYGQELMLCQRYYYRLAPANATAWLGIGITQTGTTAAIESIFPVTMRTAPTALEQTGTATDYRIITSSYTTCSSAPAFVQATQYAAQTTFTVASTTANLPVFGYTNSTSAYLGWSAEL